MPVVLESWTDIAGDDYANFLDMALDWFGFFSLVWRDSRHFDDGAIQIRRDLERHETNRRRSSHWPGTCLAHAHNPPLATVISYRLDAASRSVLDRPGSMFTWLDPRYPEDLAFYRRDGRLAFATSTHERTSWAIDLDFGYSLPKHLDFTETEMEAIDEGGFDYVA